MKKGSRCFRQPESKYKDVIAHYKQVDTKMIEVLLRKDYFFFHNKIVEMENQIFLKEGAEPTEVKHFDNISDDDQDDELNDVDYEKPSDAIAREEREARDKANEEYVRQYGERGRGGRGRGGHGGRGRGGHGGDGRGGRCRESIMMRLVGGRGGRRDCNIQFSDRGGRGECVHRGRGCMKLCIDERL